jgi:hypothetical protein
MRLFFALTIVLFLSIGHSYGQGDMIELKITTDDTMVTSKNSKIKLIAVVNNQSSGPAVILKHNEFSTSSNPTFYWLFEIKYGNNETMITEDGYLNKARIYNKGDYFKLKPKQRHTITFEIDFSKLVKWASNKELPDFTKVNREYGEYTIKLLYIDRYKKHPDSVTELNSNTIKTFYNK